MSANVTAILGQNPAQIIFSSNEEENFFDKHFEKIAFAICSLALFVFATRDFLLGVTFSFVLHAYTQQPVDPAAKVVTIPHALFTIIGSIAALLRLTPSGAAGGLLFKVVPFLGSLSVGSALYRAAKL